MATQKTFYIIDGHAQIFRAYYAIRGGMTSPVTGEPTQASFGFAGMLLKLYLTYDPDYVAMAIDMPGRTFRDELYSEYKATREPPPADFQQQEQRVLEIVRLFGIPLLGVRGAEADDVIATIVGRLRQSQPSGDLAVRIVSKDKDLEQLISDGVVLFDIHKDTTIDRTALMETKGIEPQQVCDVLALMGDTVDNIPGVAGIGPKTASKLISEYGTLDNLLAKVSQIKGKRRESIEAAADKLPLSRQLVQLKHDVELDFDLEEARALRGIDGSGLRDLFSQLGFNRHMKDLDRLLDRLDDNSTTHTDTGQTRTEEYANTLFDLEIGPTRGGGAGSGETSDHASSSALTSTADGRYEAVVNREQLEDLVAALTQAPLISVDTETIGLGPAADICGLCFAWETGHGVYVPIRSPDPSAHLDESTVFAALRPLLEDEDRPKCGHNLKYDARVLAHAGVTLRGIEFDSMIAAFLLELPARSLDAMALSLLRHEMTPISDLIGQKQRGQEQKTMDQVTLDLITPYAAEDADIALRLHEALAPRLATLGMGELSQNVEMPLVGVIAAMEANGIRVDPAILDQQKQELAARLDSLRDSILEAAGEHFNPDSPKQLAEILFKRLELPIVKRTKTGPSTDVEVLEKLVAMDDLPAEKLRVPELLLEYRGLTKLVGTYLEALVEAIDEETGRIHATFHQTGAATGRLSSSGPNLQNIPVRTEVGRRIRRAFVAEPGYKLISADYSQIELRMLAHLSRDPALTEAFQSGLDIHTAVAAQVFGVEPDEVDREKRTHAKTINFGIIYGVTPYGLARRIEGLDLDGARKLIADYRKRFAGIGRFLDQCVQQAEELGYVTTIMGRRRRIPQIKSPNPNTRSLGERLAINTVVQGSAADLIKLAMVDLDRRISREDLPMKMLLQIHDELVLEAPAPDAAAMSRVVQHEMEQAMSLRVPLAVDASIGDDWFEAK